MPTPANRAKIQIARGTFSNIDSSKGDLLDGELAYAKDLNQLYMKEGTTLQQVTAEPEQLYVEVHNDTGATLTKGKVVHVSGTHSSGKPTVALADATTADSKFPAIGLVSADIANGAEGRILISGILSGLNTNAFNAGDSLYLSATVGDLTATRPTASTDKVQKVALCTRKHTTAGDVLVIGAGRVNDVNNEITALTGVGLNATNLGTFSGSTIADNETVKGALQDLETEVENKQDSISNGSANQIFAMNGAGNAFGFVNDVTIPGNLTVSGTTTTINTQTLDVEDKNIELGKVSTPTDTTADGGGITLKGATDKTINWIDSTDAWTFSEHVNIANGKEYRINGTSVLTGSTLGSGVTTSSLTTVGTIGTGTWNADTIAVNKGGTGQTSYTNGQLLIGNSSGGLTKATLTAGSNVTITNSSGGIEIASSGGAGSSGFGDGSNSSPSIFFTSDTNTGLYRPTANVIGFSTNGSEKFRLDGDGRILLGVNAAPSGGDAHSANARFVVNGRVGNASDSGRINLKRGSAASNGSSIGSITFTDSSNNAYARIESLCDGSPGSGDNPGRLVFSTTADGAASPSERVTISNAGNLGIGTITPPRALTNANAVTLTTGTAPEFRLNGTAADDDDNDRAIFGLATGSGHFVSTSAAGDAVLRTTDGGDIIFGEGTTERFRITAAGQLQFAAAKGSVLVANTANQISALDGGGSNDGILTYTSSSDTIAWATEIDGGTY